MLGHSETTLQRLRDELAFLESGGYRHSPQSHWRAPYIFEESPSCPNLGDKARPHLCEECWLVQFVPHDRREEQVPCRFIELEPNGVTVDSLYRSGTLNESEEALRSWLHQRIREVEESIREAQVLPFR